MHLTAIMPCRNESWILGLSARAALMYCDSIVIGNHASTDDTAAIIDALYREFPGRVHFIEFAGPEWREMDHRQSLLDFVRALGATHIAPIDADEVLCGDMLPTIREDIEKLTPGQFCGIKMRNLHRSIAEYRSDNSPFGSQAGTMLAFADGAGLCWAAKNGYQHHSRSPQGSRMGGMVKGSGLMHLQFANWRRLIAKHALYKAMERTKYPQKPVAEIERTYNLAPNETGLELTAVPASWWMPYEHFMGYLNLDREPWQEAETRRLVAAYGQDYFAGLSLFGLA